MISSTTLATGLNYTFARERWNTSSILKILIQLQHLDAEYRKMDLKNTSEANVYLQRLLKSSDDFTTKKPDQDFSFLLADEAAHRALQQLAADLHNSLARSRQQSMNDQIRGALEAYLKFLRQWNEVQGESVKGIWAQRGSSYDIIG